MHSLIADFDHAESRSQQEASISGAAGDQGYAIDEQKGVILVPLDGGVDQMYRFCRVNFLSIHTELHGHILASACRVQYKICSI